MSLVQRTLWGSVALASVACVGYRDQVVTVTTQTRVAATERREERVAVADGAPLALPPLPARLDAPSIRRALDGYGEWVEHPAYGATWIPAEEQRGEEFVPYGTAGQWVASRQGWYWQSTYAWGAVPFHYGRWVMYGHLWAWVPGAAFAPAWVDWRVGNGWVGWAPLAPLGASFVASHVYCAWESFQTVGLWGVTVRGPSAVTLFSYTWEVRSFVRYGGSVYAPGPPLPVAVPTGVEQLWAASTRVAVPVGSPAPASGSGGIAATPAVGVRVTTPAREPSRLAEMMPGPTHIPDIPVVGRVLTSATGTFRAADSFPVPQLARGPQGRLALAYNAPGDAPRVESVVATSAVNGPRMNGGVEEFRAPPPAWGYGSVAPRRMTWAASLHDASPPSFAPQQGAYGGPSRGMSAPSDRPVAMPSSAAPPAMMGWRGPSPVGAYGPSSIVRAPTSFPAYAPPSVVGGWRGGGGGVVAAPTFAPSFVPSMPSAAPVMARPTTTYVAGPPAAVMAAPSGVRPMGVSPGLSAGRFGGGITFR